MRWKERWVASGKGWRVPGNKYSAQEFSMFLQNCMERYIISQSPIGVMEIYTGQKVLILEARKWLGLTPIDLPKKWMYDEENQRFARTIDEPEWERGTFQEQGVLTEGFLRELDGKFIPLTTLKGLREMPGKLGRIVNLISNNQDSTQKFSEFLRTNSDLLETNLTTPKSISPYLDMSMGFSYTGQDNVTYQGQYRFRGDKMRARLVDITAFLPCHVLTSQQEVNDTCPWPRHTVIIPADPLDASELVKLKIRRDTNTYAAQTTREGMTITTRPNSYYDLGKDGSAISEYLVGMEDFAEYLLSLNTDRQEQT